ncbi:hypothetical protein CcaCcLH18_05249 [Colletotrichum camelliae]|nr:hypothetical protein CcaCcLH18_05249 [Colletotrichum camelliae]
MSSPTGGREAHPKAADRFPPSVSFEGPLGHEQHLDGDGKSSDYPKPVSDASRSAAADDGHAGIGVSRVEAFNKVLYQSGKSGKIILWLLGISIGLTMFAYALDQGITGTIFTSVGKSGLDLLSDIIVGDLTPLQWRGFFGAALSLPFVVTVPVNGFIAEGFVDNWRWGLGMFAIVVPDTARLVIAQLLYCLGSFNVVGARVGSQASVPHEDMATIIAVLTLWSTLGSSVGSAVSSAIWTSEMLDRMRKEMPDVDEKTLAKLYGSIKKLRTTYDFDDPVRQGAIRAYAYVNGHIAITALLLAAVPLVATFFMPDFYLGKQQNAVTNTGLDGEAVDLPQRELRNEEASGTTQEQSRPFYYKWLALYRKEA